MENEEQKKKRLEEENALVLRYTKQSRIETERRERLQMLRRISNETECPTEPHDDEIDCMLMEEKQRTQTIKHMLFTARQYDTNNRNYYDESIIYNDVGEPEYKITSMITLQKLRKGSTIDKPIEVNYIMQGDRFDKEVGFIDEEDDNASNEEEHEPEKTDQAMETNPIDEMIARKKIKIKESIKAQTADKVTPGEKEKTTSEKPKIIQNIQITPANTKIKFFPDKENVSPNQTDDKKGLSQDNLPRQSPLEEVMRPEDMPGSSTGRTGGKSPILEKIYGKLSKIKGRTSTKRADGKDAKQSSSDTPLSDEDWTPTKKRTKTSKRRR